MYILQYHYFSRDEHGNPHTPHFCEIHGKKLSEVMSKYHAASMNHNLTVYTARTIDDVIDTEEH